ncbi:MULTISPECIES: lipopolysaccharide biosynthesis protein [unclassified Microbacterium]|uniref:lipopolysaccharide biosynthesis protein n=1 Tax=unclassified Microbacterium TaxID=2609290 RepID=UPI0030185DDA
MTAEIPAPTGTRVAHATGYLLAANVLRYVGPLGMLVLLAQFTTPDTVGAYTLSLAIVTPMFVFAQLSLRTVYLTIRPPVRIAVLLGVQAAALLFAAIVTGIIGGVFQAALLPLLAAAALGKIMDAYVDLLSGPLQAAGRERRIFWASLAVGAGSLAFAAAGLLATGSVVVSLVALAAGTLCAALPFLYLPVRRAEREAGTWSWRADADTRARVVRAGVPMGVAIAIMSLMSVLPQYVLAGVIGQAVAGRFAVMLYMYAVADIAGMSLAQAWIPTGRRSYETGEPRRWLARPVLLWTALFLPATVFGLWLGAMLLPLLFGPAFGFGIAEAVPLGCAIVLLPFAHFTAITVSIQNRYTHVLALSAAAVVVSATLCAVLIPIWGLAGGFWALAAAIGVRGIVALVFVLRH